MHRRVTVLGSTGSIGRQTLDVVEQFPDEFEVVGLAARQSVEELARQVRRFTPEVVAVADLEAAQALKARLAADGLRSVEVLSGPSGVKDVAGGATADVVVQALMGAAGIEPTIEALRGGRQVALANKESLVAAGEVVTRLAREHGGQIVPIDSEHSAIYQCLCGVNGRAEVKALHVTASGGPFLRTTRREMERVTPEAALRHPTWQMGTKITIDSATLMNKGLEVIEAHWLFDMDFDAIRVLVHPESIIHSMVELIDGSILAQLGVADMRIPIQYALMDGKRRYGDVRRLDLSVMGSLHFEPPDVGRFPALRLAYEAGKAGGTLPAVFNAANEEAVKRFLAGDIGFLQIPELVERAMEAHEVSGATELGAILQADAWARAEVSRYVEGV